MATSSHKEHQTVVEILYVSKLLKEGELPTIRVQNSNKTAPELLAKVKELEKASGKKFHTKEFPAAPVKSRNQGLMAPSRTFSAADSSSLNKSTRTSLTGSKMQAPSKIGQSRKSLGGIAAPDKTAVAAASKPRTSLISEKKKSTFGVKRNTEAIKSRTMSDIKPHPAQVKKAPSKLESITETKTARMNAINSKL